MSGEQLSDCHERKNGKDRDMNTMELHYEKHKRLLWKVAHAFQKRHGGIWDEILSEAHVFYLKALRNHNWRRGNLSKRVAYKVWFGLISSDTLRRKQSQRMPLQTIDGEKDYLESKRDFRIESLLSDVSEDAGYVLEVALTSPNAKVEHQRSRIVQFFQEIGWTTQRIIESFREIQEALS